MLNIVVIEDYAPLRESLVELLATEGRHVSAFDSAENFTANCSLKGIDIIVLDLNLPGEDGISLARRVRKLDAGIGIVMLTARNLPQDRRIGYDNGADIYLAKPSSVEELTAAILSLARRIRQTAGAETSLALEAGAAPITLVHQAMSLVGPLGKAALSASETAMLRGFILAPDNRLAHDELAALTNDGPVSKSTLGVKIVRLRRKLMDVGAPDQPIRVVRNWGYQLTVAMAIT